MTRVPLLAYFLAFTILVPVHADDKPKLEANWWAIQTHAVKVLFKRDLTEWITEIEKAKPTGDPAEMMLRFNIAIRAGHEEFALEVVDAIKKMKDPPRDHELSQMADHLIGRENDELARLFIERMPKANPGWGYVLIKRWVRNGGDPDVIDQWLVDRYEASKLDYWFNERLRFRREQGTAKVLIDALAADVRKNQTDLLTAKRYTAAVRMIGTQAYAEHHPRWMGDVCKPKLAIESQWLGQDLQYLAPHAAIKLFNRSLATKFTDADAKHIEEMKKHMAVALVQKPTKKSMERELRLWTKHSLMETYKKTGQADKAQPLLEELTKDYPDGIPYVGLSQMAGQIQAASGKRVIEGRIKKAEKENKDDYKYWLKRAQYYVGRKEDKQAIEAFEKSLKLARAMRDRVPKNSRYGTESYVISTYAHYLRQSKGSVASVTFLKEQLEQFPVDADIASFVVGWLIEHDRDRQNQVLTHNDPLLWKYLTARRKWSYREQRVISLFVSRCPKADVDVVWDKAEKLAGKDTHPSRAQTLAWCMVSFRNRQRAIPLLQDAMARLETPDERASAATTLFDAYLQTGQWKLAEEIWPVTMTRLTAREKVEWLGRLIIAAAKAGDRENATRLFIQRVNLDRIDMRGVNEMIKAGLNDEITTVYEELATKDPKCVVALKRELGRLSSN